MTTPTTNLSFGNVQTEFGGANPISISEYYRGAGGGYVPVGQATSATDGVAVSTSGLIRVGMFRGLTKVTAASLPGGLDVFGSYLSTAARSVFMTFYSNGTVSGFGHGNVLQWTYNWYNPTTVGIGTSYWIRATLQSGLAPSSGTALGTWASLNLTPGWTYTAPTGGVYQVRQGVLALSLATDAAGSNIISTGLASFYVERES